MESLQDLLGKYTPQEPPEIAAIKSYVEEHFSTTPRVALQGESAIIITVQSAALANTLRFHITKLQEACDTTRRIVLRIG